MSPTLRTPGATAFSAHRRAADQNAILCAAQQKRFGEPPRRGRNGRLHHRHSGKVIMRNSSAVTEGGGPPRALPTRLERLGYRLDHRRQPFAGKFAKIGQLAKPAPAQRCRLTCTRIATSRHMPAAMRTASGSVPDDASRRVRFGRPGKSGHNIPKNRCRTTVPERMVETRGGTAVYRRPGRLFKPRPGRPQRT